MAKFDNIILIAALCLTVGSDLISCGLAAEDVPSEAPSYDDLGDPQLPPEPSPGYYNFLDQCVKGITPECSKEIFEGMFEDVETLTEPCCSMLLSMGKECHTELVKTLLELPKLKHVASKALIKSEELWNACDTEFL